MKPRLYLLWIHLCTFFPMFAIHMCEKICFFPEILVRHYVLCVCTCTNQLVLSTEVTRLNFLNSIVMGQINQCGFQSHVAINRYCIFLEINTFELSWVEMSLTHQLKYIYQYKSVGHASIDMYCLNLSYLMMFVVKAQLTLSDLYRCQWFRWSWCMHQWLMLLTDVAGWSSSVIQRCCS